jgi:hypothetical protein
LLLGSSIIAISSPSKMASFGRSIGNVGKIADQPVFVTGNANKLKEVKAILAAGDSGIEITSKAVDGKSRHLKRDQDLMYRARHKK